jgi:hypothetical protein
MVPEHALVYENAERADRAAAFLTETDGRRLPFSRWSDDEQDQGIAVAIADVLLLAESTGRPTGIHLVKGLQYFRDSVAAELAEADDLAGELVKTRCCGHRVDQVRRWFQPCHECAAQDGWEAPPDPIPGTPEYRSATVRAATAAVEAYAALAGLDSFEQSAIADRERLLAAFRADLRHVGNPAAHDDHTSDGPSLHSLSRIVQNLIDDPLDGCLQVVRAAELHPGDAFLNAFDPITRVETVAEGTLIEIDTEVGQEYQFAAADQVVVYRPENPDQAFGCGCGCTWWTRCKDDCDQVRSYMQEDTLSDLAHGALAVWLELNSTKAITRPWKHHNR